MLDPLAQPFGGKMKILSALVLYTASLLGANAALADMSALEALREGDMKKLTFHAEPQPVSDTPFEAGEGGEMTLAEYEGKIVVLNFWATWCAPCRKEMPMLSELQTELGGDDFEVVTLATGRNPPPAMKAFFDEIGVDNLPLHRDPRSQVAREMGVLGLPITVILDRDGQEIARLRGDAHWNSDSAKAILRRLIDAGA
jgi:thiol-disulfide isomerase/thioredoxin